MASASLASFRQDIVQAQQLLMKEVALASGDDSSARVAQAAVEKVAVPAAAAVVALSEQRVRLAAIQRGMPRMMIDYRGGVSHVQPPVAKCSAGSERLRPEFAHNGRDPIEH